MCAHNDTLFIAMEQFPLKFCKPVYFGDNPSPSMPSSINNGTMTLIRKNNIFYGVTCHHVMKGYRERLSENPETFFSIANTHLKPESQLKFEDDVTDIAILELSETQAAEINSTHPEIGSSFFDISDTENEPVNIGDYLAYGGFPGESRRLQSFAELSFGTYSSGACRVTDKHSDYIGCQFERENWITHGYEPEPTCLGGLSGGPAFKICHSPTGVINYKFIGIIFKMHEDSESLYIRAISSEITVP